MDMIRKIVEKIGSSLGLVIIPKWRVVQLDEEHYLGSLLPYLEVDCVFDVGANIGQYANTLRRYIGYEGRIISFEPDPLAFRQLKSNAAGDPLWHVEPFALGKSPSMAQMHCFNDSKLSSFRSFSDSHHAPTNATENTVEVEIKTLEAYFAQSKEKWGFKRPFLKMDTQGFDLEVIQGAGETIRDFVGLQSEIAFQSIYDNSPNYITSIKEYEGKGFVLGRLIPIHDIHFPELVEMDVIMVRSDLVKKQA